jgi:thiamine pyrophosphate-dependent acetolactate synthase large subunit-like protein
MRRAEVVALIAERRTDEPVIVSAGSSSGALYELGHRAPTIYNMEMGYATSTCLGLALALPDTRVVSIEGDGSTVVALGVFATIAAYRPTNLVMLVLDNHLYESCGDGAVPTVTAGATDLAAVARACGVDAEHVLTPATDDEVVAAVDAAWSGPGPWVLVVPIPSDRLPASSGPPARRPLPRHDVVETAVAFKREMIERGHSSGGQTS